MLPLSHADATLAQRNLAGKSNQTIGYFPFSRQINYLSLIVTFCALYITN